jgi:hypothetical protein
MKLKSRKTGYIVLVFSLLLAAQVCAPQGAHANIRCCSNINCNVTGNQYCSNGVLAFGSIDPSSTGNKTATITTNQYFSCNTLSNWNATVASTWTMTGPVGGSMAYSVGYTASSSCSGTTETLLTATSTITQAAYQDAPAGNYTNSAQVTFTIVNSGGGGTINPILDLASAVTATILNTCGSAVGGTMLFPIDPSLAGPITANTTANGTSPSVKCTKNATHVIACTSSGLLTSGGNTIAYTITGCATPITGNGFSTITSIPIGVSMAQAAYQDKPAGNYIDTITVTVTF